MQDLESRRCRVGFFNPNDLQMAQAEGENSRE